MGSQFQFKHIWYGPLYFSKNNFWIQIWTIDSFHQTNQNQLFGALVMRVLQPTNLNTIEPANLKICPSELSGEPWWSTTMILVMVSLFDQFVPFSSFEWKAKIWIGSHLILQYYFSWKGLICQQPMRIQDFLELWLDDENSNSMLKNRICPGNKPRLFWVTFKLMIFQNFENFHFFENLKNFVKSTWSSSQSFQACSFYCFHFEFGPSHWSIFWPLDGNISFWGNKRSSSLFFHFVRKSPNSADLPCWPF